MRKISIYIFLFTMIMGSSFLFGGYSGAAESAIMATPLPSPTIAARHSSISIMERHWPGSEPIPSPTFPGPGDPGVVMIDLNLPCDFFASGHGRPDGIGTEDRPWTWAIGWHQNIPNKKICFRDGIFDASGVK